MKRLLIITDSLGLPRNVDGEEVSFESTWVQRLKKHYYVHQVSIGGATISELFLQIHYHVLFNPDYVVIQSGIVDCSPRAFGRVERQILGSLPGIKRLFRYVSKNYGKKIRSIRQKSYTRLPVFEDVVKAIPGLYFPSIPVIYLGIVPAMEGYEARVPGISKKIRDYNTVLAGSPHFISLEEMMPRHILSDFHHLSEEGNAFIYEKVLSKLGSIDSNR